MPFILVLCLLLSVNTAAHELQENRATLVLRDNTHISVTLYVRASEVLYRTLMPGTSYQEFLLAYSTMTEEDFQKNLTISKMKFKQNTKAILNNDTKMEIANWLWPTAAQLQSVIRQQVMTSIMGDSTSNHEETIEIHADIIYNQHIQSAQLKLPEELGKVMLIWYHPQQLWVDANQQSPIVNF